MIQYFISIAILSKNKPIFEETQISQYEPLLSIWGILYFPVPQNRLKKGNIHWHGD
jgi:hypothetical protein